MIDIEYHEKLPGTYNDYIIRELEIQAKKKKSIENGIKTFSLVMMDGDDFIGAASGFSYYECLHISLLFVKEIYRSKGYGKALIGQLGQSETLAKERGCRIITVNSMDWEAPAYYTKLDYSIDYIQDGYAQGSKKYFLKKLL